MSKATFKHYTKFMLKLIFLLSFFPLLSGCTEVPAESAIAEQIEKIQTAIENKNSQKVLKTLSESFNSAQGMDRQGVKRLLLAYFLRHKNIKIYITNNNISYNPAYPNVATSESAVTVTGAESILPNQSGIYKVKTEWVREDGEWLVSSVSWE
ncbi:hypothetical protein H0A36_12725 [Endozoicomonas sp. SM1973]|uniref:DUF4440 domain-containing protein n=1 Tax=Spartinivicinus marinus TaxID=2994442 RepID=A0A853IBH1_9GAMM|nr:hypothetical protein [Spartinivicinus marinus]MCX4026505.1 hypothetical protein [Spartinivicinus marinus]NYZ66877.1 hypothetical protein [Spartinivicinus marinus]